MNADLWGRRLCHNCTAALPSHHTFYPYAETRGFGTKTDDVTPICSRLLHLALSVHDITALTRSVEENVSSEESGEIWFGSRLFFALFFFWLRGFSYPPFPSLCFPLPSVDPLCVRSVTSHRPTQSSFCVRTLSLWPTASMLASQTDGRKDRVSEWGSLFMHRQTEKTNKKQLFDFEWQLVAANLLRCILQSFYLYRISRINDDTVTLR